MIAQTVPKVLPTPEDQEDSEPEWKVLPRLCAPAKEKVTNGCTNARSALSIKPSVILLDSDEDSKKPSELDSDEYSETYSERSSEVVAESSMEEAEEESSSSEASSEEASQPPEEEPTEDEEAPDNTVDERRCLCVDFYSMCGDRCMQTAEPDSIYCAFCTTDSCHCCCSNCRTIQCTKRMKDTEQCVCFCCKSDRRALSFQTRSNTTNAGASSSSIEPGSLTQPDITKKEKVKFAPPRHCGCQRDDCESPWFIAPSLEDSQTPPTICRPRLAEHRNREDSDEPWEQVPAAKHAVQSRTTHEYLVAPVSGPIYFMTQCFGSSDSEEASSERAIPGIEEERSEGSEEEEQDDPDFPEEEEEDDPDLPVPEVGPIEAPREEDRAEAAVLAEEPETKGRRDLRVEATSIRHLLTHLPKNPHCVSCQQAKMRQRYSHKGAFKREIDQFG